MSKKIQFILCFLFFSLSIQAANLIDVKQQIRDDNLIINPQYDLPISDKVIEAIDNGIIITFVVQTKLFEEVDWWFDNNLAHSIKTFQVRYFSLSSLYQLHNIRNDEKLSFPTLEDLMAYIGEEVFFEFKLNSAATYLKTRIFLDKQALPSIMQLPNVFDADWNFNSDWQTRPIQHNKSESP